MKRPYKCSKCDRVFLGRLGWKNCEDSHADVEIVEKKMLSQTAPLTGMITLRDRKTGKLTDYYLESRPSRYMTMSVFKEYPEYNALYHSDSRMPMRLYTIAECHFGNQKEEMMLIYTPAVPRYIEEAGR